jgi:UDP-GlcNAc:undecaprenyl-phosphate GlcNAc-1-phosphate transferase
MTYFITPICKKIALATNILDFPGGRKIQSMPVAYLGGVAIALPITLCSIIVLFSELPIELKYQFYFGLILPSVFIALVGLLDDIFELSPFIKFFAQSGVGIITSYLLYINAGGFKISNKNFQDALLTTFWVVTVMNALNFMDNMDGHATSISIIISISLFIISILNNQYLVAALCITITSACFGFIFWNKRPASIYLGDAGALYLGFLLSAISIRLDTHTNSISIKVLILLLIFAVPIIDLLQVVTNRCLSGKSPFEGGRDHLSHLLLNNGIKEDSVLLILILASVFFAGWAILLSVAFN